MITCFRARVTDRTHNTTIYIYISHYVDAKCSWCGERLDLSQCCFSEYFICWSAFWFWKLLHEFVAAFWINIPSLQLGNTFISKVITIVLDADVLDFWGNTMNASGDWRNEDLGWGPFTTSPNMQLERIQCKRIKQRVGKTAQVSRLPLLLLSRRSDV